MKSINKLVCLFLILVSIQSNAQQFKTTITYKLIRMDSDIWGENEAEIRACEELITSAVIRITKTYSQIEIKNADTQVAVNILKKIDSTFTEFRFLYCTNISDVHYDHLTLAFRDSFTADNFLFGENSRNKYRKSFWRQNQLRNCFLIDCDLYCQVYYGIAQMLSLPLYIVATPQHNYLRWRINDDKYFCWDTNEGEAHFDETTISGYGQINNDNRSQYLQDWTLADIEGHYKMVRGDYFF
jgi:hypothetical protein